MLTRIVSGAVMILIAISVMLTHKFLTPIIAIVLLALLTAKATKEILYNTRIVRNKIIASVAVVFAGTANTFYYWFPENVMMLTVGYVLFVVVCAVVWNEEFTTTTVASTIAFPIVLAYSFNSIYTVYAGYGFAYLFLIANCSAICDAGAYFVGVTIGRHKLCPSISPKKTVEGAIGGIVVSEIVTVITVIIADIKSELILLMILTLILCIIGMIGDLFASIIKRGAGIKDYGRIIPGHGGILDRFDSILLIAPAFLQLLMLVEAMKI